MNSVLVVFAGEARIGWLRVLKPGFRHCFAAVRDPEGWILYSPISQETKIEIVAPPAYDLAGFYRDQGYRVVEARREATGERAAPWGLFTCVEAVKRLLGIRARRVVTPWQLNRYLEKSWTVDTP